MTTSETYSQTAGQIINRALKDARIFDPNQPVQPQDLQNGLEAIDTIAKFWQTQGAHLWVERRAIIPLVKGQRKYLLGPNGDDVAVASTFFTTTLNGALIAAASVITLVATTGLNQDGQIVAISGAPDLLLSDPTTTTQDWTAINSGTLAIVSEELELTNGAAVAGGADFSLETTIGVTYQVELTYVQGTSASANFTALDTTGTLDTVNLTASGSSTLTFTARDLTTTFRFENGSAVSGETSLMSDLQYRNKAAGDRIGLELTDGSRFWDNVVTVDSATQVTINNGIPSAAATSLSVYSYETPIARPLRIMQAQFGSSFADSEIPTNQWSRAEYFDQPDKDSSGTVTQWYYSPTLILGELFIWQVASSINQVLRVTYVDPINIPTEAEDILEFPAEWYMPLKWAIAAELGPQYGVKDNRQLVLESKATGTLESALGHDVERDSMSLQPDFN